MLSPDRYGESELDIFKEKYKTGPV